MSAVEFNLSNLMDLAVVDTSDLSAQTSRLQAEGIYVLDLEELKFAEQPPQDPADPMNFILRTRGLIVHYEGLEGGNDEAVARKAAELIGRNLSEGIFLRGTDVREAIQLLMGRFKNAGFKHKGLMGGVEGTEPGWVDEAVGKRIVVRVRHYTSRSDGQDRASIDWLTPKAMAKAGIPWETMQRDYLDENGSPVELEAAA